MIKEIIYDLDPFIIDISQGVEDDSCTNDFPLESKTEEEENQEFMSQLTLSKFRKDLTEIANEQFQEEYGIEKNSLGIHCKLFMQKQ